jgi:hypothetical protein
MDMCFGIKKCFLFWDIMDKYVYIYIQLENTWKIWMHSGNQTWLAGKLPNKMPGKIGKIIGYEMVDVPLPCLPKGHGYISSPKRSNNYIYHYHKVGVLLMLDIFLEFLCINP